MPFARVAVVKWKESSARNAVRRLCRRSGAAPPAPGTYAAPVRRLPCGECGIDVMLRARLDHRIIFLVLEPYSKNRAVRSRVSVDLPERGRDRDRDCIGHRFRILLGILGFFVSSPHHLPIFGLGCLCLWLYLLFSTYQGKTSSCHNRPLAQKQAQS